MPVNRHGVELGVLVGLGNLLIFNHNLPPAVDVKAGPQFDSDVEKSERMALMECTALTLLVAGFARSVETFMVAGAVLVATDFAFKHANAVHPDTGTMLTPGATDAGASIHPMPDYGPDSESA
jgi:hypothetical protein